MKIHLFKRLAKYYLNFLFSFLISSYSFAQERWFQIELSIFSNENTEDRNAESSADDDSTTTTSTSQTMLGMMFGSSQPNSDNANSPADGETTGEQQTSYFSGFGFG